MYSTLSGLVKQAQAGYGEQNLASLEPALGGMGKESVVAEVSGGTYTYVPMVAPSTRPRRISVCFWVKIVVSVFVLAAIVGAGVHALHFFQFFENKAENLGEDLVEGFSKVAGDVGGEVTAFIEDAGHDVSVLANSVSKAGGVLADHSKELVTASGNLLGDAMDMATTLEVAVDDVLMSVEEALRLSFWMVECSVTPGADCEDLFYNKYHLCQEALKRHVTPSGWVVETLAPCRYTGELGFNRTYRAARDQILLQSLMREVKKEEIPDRQLLLAYVKKTGADRANERTNGKNTACSTDLSPAALEACSMKHCLLPGGVRGMKGHLFVECVLATTESEWRVVSQLSQEESSHIEDVAMRLKGAHKVTGAGFPLNTPPPAKRRPPNKVAFIPDLTQVGGSV